MMAICLNLPSGDLLWQQGSQRPPNEGFTLQRIFPLAAPESWEAAEGSSSSNGAAAAAGSNSGSTCVVADELEQLRVSGSRETTGAAAVTGDGGGATTAGGNAPAVAPADARMDALLEAAVLAGLQTLTNAQLPMLAREKGAGAVAEAL